MINCQFKHSSTNFKTGYYLQILTFETIKLLESNARSITKNEYGKNLPQLKTTGKALVHHNIIIIILILLLINQHDS